jgi:endonuclease/exonuclease/phosphatase family metal-dependent hydrolase
MSARSAVLGLLATALIALGFTSRAGDAGGLPPPFDSAITGSFGPDQTPKSSTLHLISWNIDRGYQFDRIEQTLRERQATVCLLQEVDLHARRTGNRDVARELAKSLNYNFAFGAEFEELSQGTDTEPAFHGQATMSRLPVAKARVLRFERQSSWWQPHTGIPNTPFFQRRLGGRIALVTELELDNSKLVVYNLHLESRSGGAIQSAQLNEVLADLNRYPKDTPAIIGGDLNSKYHPSTVLQFLRQQGFQSVLGDNLQRTHVIIGYLDWIFYRGQWHVESGEVVRGSHASDHDPIVATLTRSASAQSNVK